MRYGGDSGSPSRKSVTGQTALLFVGWVSGGDPCGAGSRRSRSASLQLQIHVPFWGSNLNVQTCYGSIRIRTAPNGAPLTRNLEPKLEAAYGPIHLQWTASGRSDGRIRLLPRCQCPRACRAAWALAVHDPPTRVKCGAEPRAESEGRAGKAKAVAFLLAS
jgi:hypothetical protein